MKGLLAALGALIGAVVAPAPAPVPIPVRTGGVDPRRAPHQIPRNRDFH
ncbi:hypothetical protein [Pararhodobacter sp.]|nr:hypothetical protein [Pseudomonadota bacterium]